MIACPKLLVEHPDRNRIQNGRTTCQEGQGGQRDGGKVERGTYAIGVSRQVNKCRITRTTGPIRDRQDVGGGRPLGYWYAKWLGDRDGLPYAP